MTLHTVNKQGDCLARCLSLTAPGDAVLLIEDGVYAAAETEANSAAWENAPAGLKCFALESDLAVRGISDKMLPLFDAVTWQQFVALTVEHDKVISWG